MAAAGRAWVPVLVVRHSHHVGILTERPYELPQGYTKHDVSPA